MFIVYFLRRAPGRYSRKQITAGCIAAGFCVILLYQIWYYRFGSSLPSLNVFVLAAFVLLSVPVFWIYPGRKHKNLFFIAINVIVSGTGHSFGNLTEKYVHHSPIKARLADLIILTILLTLMLAGLIWFVRYRFPMLYESETSPYWKYLWQLTISLGFIQLLNGTSFQPSSFQAGRIIPSQLACLSAAIVIMYVAGSAHRQSQITAELEMEMEMIDAMAKEKDRQYENIISNMTTVRRLNHDLRQINTVIGSLNKPDTRNELIRFCDEALSMLEQHEGKTL